MATISIAIFFSPLGLAFFPAVPLLALGSGYMAFEAARRPIMVEPARPQR